MLLLQQKKMTNSPTSLDRYEFPYYNILNWMRKAMRERVSFANHSERETYAESFLWRPEEKTTPEL